MAKKFKRSKPLQVVKIDSVKQYKTFKGTFACVGTVGTHSIYREGGTAKAAFNRVQTSFNKYFK